MNNNAENNSNQPKTTRGKATADLHKALFKERELSLIKQKEELGYGDLSFKELLETQPDDMRSQFELSKFLKLQSDVRELESEREQLWIEDKVVEELNKIHAVVHTDQFFILTEKENTYLKGNDFTLESKSSFKNQYENKRVLCSDEKIRSKADIWLSHPNRREYKGIIFAPKKEQEKQGYYNIWRGFSVSPKKGDASKFWNHVKNIICSGNEEYYTYVRKWCASIFQRPDEVHTALVLIGSQGIGKNTFVDRLGDLFGAHYAPLSSISELVSNFNFHLKNAVLIHANEALWGGNRKEIGTLKAMITEKLCLIEGKGKDRIVVPNFKHIILSSNEDWPVHLDSDDRRFFVLKVSEKRKEDHSYFATIAEEMNNGGLEALLYDLLNEDISTFNPRSMPLSPDAFEIKLRSLDSSGRYTYEALLSGSFDIGNATPQKPWQSEYADSVYADYLAWCGRNGEAFVAQNQFSKKLRILIPSIQPSRPRVSSNTRRLKYLVPSLEKARKEFCLKFKATDSIWHLDSINDLESQVVDYQCPVSVDKNWIG